MSKTITVANNKSFKGVTRIEAIMHQDVGSLLVFPLIQCIRTSRSYKVQLVVHSRLCRNIIIRVVTWRSVCWQRGMSMHILLRGTFIGIIGDSNGDRLACNIHENVFNGTPPACADHVTSQAADYYQCKVERLVLRGERGSVNIVRVNIWSIRQVGRL